MKPVSLSDALHNAVDEIVLGDENYTYVLYLKDGDGGYHKVNTIDLYSDRINCEDEYWDCYSWILEAEKSGEEARLFAD